MQLIAGDRLARAAAGDGGPARYDAIASLSHCAVLNFLQISDPTGSLYNNLSAFSVYNIYIFLKDFIFQKTLYEKLQN